MSKDKHLEFYLKQYSARLTDEQDLATGYGYKTRRSRDLHRVWTGAYMASGIRSNALTKKEKDSGKFKEFPEKQIKQPLAIKLYILRIKLGKSFYQNNAPRVNFLLPSAVKQKPRGRNVVKDKTIKPKPIPIRPANIIKFKPINTKNVPVRKLLMQPFVRSDAMKTLKRTKPRNIEVEATDKKFTKADIVKFKSINKYKADHPRRGGGGGGKRGIKITKNTPFYSLTQKQKNKKFQDFKKNKLVPALKATTTKRRNIAVKPTQSNTKKVASEGLRTEQRLQTKVYNKYSSMAKHDKIGDKLKNIGRNK